MCFKEEKADKRLEMSGEREASKGYKKSPVYLAGYFRSGNRGQGTG